MAVVSVGVYTQDLYMFGPRLPNAGETVEAVDYGQSHGGKAANQAVAAARLGAEVALLTRLGQDAVGHSAHRLFTDEGIDVRGVELDPSQGTGASFVILDAHGQQLITTYAGASTGINRQYLQRYQEILRDASVLLLQGETSAEAALAAAELAGKGTIVILDPSPIETFANVPLDWVHILTPNQHEAALLTGMPKPSAQEVSRRTGVPTVLLTLGGEGVELYHQGSSLYVPAAKVPVVDTTGAGDAFNGALAAGLDRGLPLVDAVRHAARCAAISVGRRYCIPSYPTLEELPWA